MKNIRENILEKVNIVEEIGNYLELEKSGQNYKCICPFHEDTNPSLTVSEEKRIFKCFVCGEGGTVIEFVQKFERISNKEAEAKLGKKIGIEIKETPKNELNVVLDNINLFYQKILQNSEYGLEAKKYLEEIRYLDEEQIERFEIGYSPKYSTVLYEYIVEFMKNNNISILNLEKLNIFSEKNYDLLNDRITFPIHDENDNIIGFSGRAIDNPIKYLNSKQSELFDKGKTLYNFNQVIKLNTRELMVVEGFFDVITAYKSGIKKVVATMGVAFTNHHINMLKKHKIKNIYLGFDQDNAGRLTTNKTAKILIENGFLVKVVSYGDYKDIDEYLNDVKATEEYIKKQANDYIIYLLNERNNGNLNIDEKSKLINEICNLFKFYENNSKKDLLIEEVAQVLQIDKNIILNQIPKNTVSINQNFVDELIESPSFDEVLEKEFTNVAAVNKEKLLFYIATQSYEKFLELENCVKDNKFEFWLYLKDYEKLKMLYDEEKKIDYVTLLDELEFYYEIDKSIKEKYGIINFESINIYNYLNDEKKKSKLKFKKLEEINKGR